MPLQLFEGHAVDHVLDDERSVGDGEYGLRASAEGFAPYAGDQRVRADGDKKPKAISQSRPSSRSSSRPPSRSSSRPPSRGADTGEQHTAVEATNREEV